MAVINFRWEPVRISKLAHDSSFDLGRSSKMSRQIRPPPFGTLMTPMTSYFSDTRTSFSKKLVPVPSHCGALPLGYRQQPRRMCLSRTASEQRLAEARARAAAQSTPVVQPTPSSQQQQSCQCDYMPEKKKQKTEPEGLGDLMGDFDLMAPDLEETGNPSSSAATIAESSKPDQDNAQKPPTMGTITGYASDSDDSDDSEPNLLNPLASG